jgi:hypothetical protein
MDSEPLPLPVEFRHALDASGGLPLRFEDPETHELYILQSAPVEITLDEEYINRELEKGLADIEAGRVVPWDPERIKEEGRRMLAERRTGG